MAQHLDRNFACETDMTLCLDDFDRFLQNEEWNDIAPDSDVINANPALTGNTSECIVYEASLEDLSNPPQTDGDGFLSWGTETGGLHDAKTYTAAQAQRSTRTQRSEDSERIQANAAILNSYTSRLPRRRSKYQIRRSISGEPQTISSVNVAGNSFAIERPISRGRSSVDVIPSYRSDSQSSLDSRLSNSAPSAASSRSASSTGIGIGRPRSKSRLRKREPRAQGAAGGQRARPFKCTFCCDSFRNKYDWSRHERTLHLNLELWTCTPYGGIISDEATGSARCAYCRSVDPDATHLEGHFYQLCIARSPEQRRFLRKDHVFQHLRSFHKLETMPFDIDSWKSDTQVVTSRCGFCNLRMQNWQERADHLALHFRQGRTMQDWKGDHEFEESVAAQVRNALPLYYIHTEGLTPLPFSATNPHARDQHAQISWSAADARLVANPSTLDATIPTAEAHVEPNTLSDAVMASRTRAADTFSSILFEHLGCFAQEQMRSGVVVTDDMLRREARIVCSGHDDPWDQTIADSPEWMATFRQRHGLL